MKNADEREPEVREITLSCEYEEVPMLGFGWNAEAVFSSPPRRPARQGVGFTCRNSWDQGPGVGQKKGLQFPGPLSWRSAAQALIDGKIEGLTGDLLEEISVGGLDAPWQEELLAMAWITYESPYSGTLRFLMSLEDAELDELYGALGSFTCPEVKELQEALEGAGISGMGLRQACMSLGRTYPPTVREVIEEPSGNESPEIVTTRGLPVADQVTPMESEIEDQVTPMDSEIALLVKAYRSIEFAGFRGGHNEGYHRESRVWALRDFLRAYAIAHSRLPTGIVHVPGIGSMDLSSLIPDA